MKNWKKIDERIAYTGWRSVLIKTFRLPNGKETKFDVIRNDDFVTIAAFTQQEEAILIRQFRVGAERILVSFAEGGIEEGETLEEAAARELLEETGYKAGHLTFLKTFHQSYSTQKQHVILATDCQKVTDQKLDDSEFIEVINMPLPEFRNFIKNKNDDTMSHNVNAAYLALDELGRL